jgi:hypothetical protein
MLRKLHAALVRDLQPKKADWFNDPRTYTGPRYDYWDSYQFKVMRQLQHFAKRVLFSTDPDFDRLSSKSFAEFVDSQASYGLPDTNPSAKLVLQRARAICSDILGEFDFDEFSKMCAFGKRAAADLPYRESYLDERVKTLNGSQSQQEWFKAILCNDIILHRACRREMKNFVPCESLELKAVPKSFKSARIIAPDTTLGGFLSRGLGLMVRKRLEGGTHINLKKQQFRHKDLAKRSSIDDYCCTIDMSRASDSFVWEHVEALTPISWHDVFNTVRTPVVTIGALTFEIRSYMLMGSGHTFPLQTLLFYCLVRAVLELMGSQATVDVYGDDIIFPASYSHYVIATLGNLGFTVNEDKSFVEGPFRESCGGDYHRGVDVRPFMPEHECGKYSAHEYTELLHSWANGLLKRWSYEEIPETYDLILLEIVSIWSELCVVPAWETETAGLKYVPRRYSVLVSKPAYENGITRYRKLVRVQKKRKPKLLKPYCWYWHWVKRNVEYVDDPWITIRDDAVETREDEPQASGLLSRHQMEVKKGCYKTRWVVV